MAIQTTAHVETAALQTVIVLEALSPKDAARIILVSVAVLVPEDSAKVTFMETLVTQLAVTLLVPVTTPPRGLAPPTQAATFGSCAPMVPRRALRTADTRAALDSRNAIRTVVPLSLPVPSPQILPRLPESLSQDKDKFSSSTSSTM